MSDQASVHDFSASAGTGDQLVLELERLGLRYLSRSPSQDPGVPLSPEALIAGLAASSEARLQVALVPLFLWRPGYASAVAAAADSLSGNARVMLQCCYSAAIALQQRYAVRLAQLGRPVSPLPDFFVSDLDLLPLADPAARLATVAARHAQLSGMAINWLGTYEHAATTFLKYADM